MLNLSLKFLKNLPQLHGKIPVKSLSSSARFEANFVRRHLIKFVQLRLKSQPWQKLMDFSTMFLSSLDSLIPISSEIHFASCKIKGKTSLFDRNLFNIS